MPRKEDARKCKKRAYTVKHSEDMLELAIEALKNKTMSSYEAQKVFGIPRRTLLDKLNNKHPKIPGCPTRLTNEEECNTIKVLIAAADYGSPLTLLDLRMVVYKYLEENGRLHIFNNKLPGKKWAYSFIKRHKEKLSYRVVQNIKRNRAEKSLNEIKEYFKNLLVSLEGVPSENIVNYDETNLADNPGAQKCLFKRGVKYPERVMNYTKGAISIMFAIIAGGESLPPYVVYKAEHLYTQWTVNGPKGSRFNRSKTGWFDSTLFEDWFETIILPWAKNKCGTKVLIGDNLASHISFKIVTYCEQNDIRFVFLPPNSSHLTQPLDVCYFGPLKKLWREILLNYKIKNPREATIHKGHFPELLKLLVEKLNDKTYNIISAFKSTGITPLNPDKVISKLPGLNQSITYTIDNALLDWLKETRSADPNKKERRKKLNITPGKSVCTNDFDNYTTTPSKIKKVNKKQQKDMPRVKKENSDVMLQFSQMFQSPDSLNKLCIRSINNNLVQFMLNAEFETHASDVLYLGKVRRNSEENMPFIDELPGCLQTNKKKIIITSDVTIKKGLSHKFHQRKQGRTNLRKNEVKITRSALRMKLTPIKKDTEVEQRRVLKEISQEINKLEYMTNTFEEKPKEKAKKRKLKNKEKRPAKDKKQKHPSVLRRARYNSSSVSSLTSDMEMSIADSDSEYETMDDFINMYQEEELENIDSTVPHGLSEIKYFTDQNDKLKIDTWIMAKFVSKKSVKHFVGKVISMKDSIPEVKFVRKVKESKHNTVSVFTYPTVDDICTVRHLDDIILVLPNPNISRRGQILFDIDLSNYNVQ